MFGSVRLVPEHSRGAMLLLPADDVEDHSYSYPQDRVKVEMLPYSTA